MNKAILNNLITAQLPTKEQTVQVVALADHVCIISTEDYTTHEHTYFGLAPYSINISKGIFA